MCTRVLARTSARSSGPAAVVDLAVALEAAAAQMVVGDRVGLAQRGAPRPRRREPRACGSSPRSGTDACRPRSHSRHKVDQPATRGETLRRTAQDILGSPPNAQPVRRHQGGGSHHRRPVPPWRSSHDVTPRSSRRAAAPAISSCDGVTVTFGGLTALSDVSLEVARHRVVGVIGPNGAGKTTLFNVVCGFVRPDSGDAACAAARPLRGLRPHDLTRLGIARTLQGLGLFDRLTVLENVMVGADQRRPRRFAGRLLGLPRSRSRRAAAARAGHGRPGRRSTSPRTPTGCPRQPALRRPQAGRAGPRARRRARLLLLDEPAGGLSADDIDELAQLVRGARADRMSVMLVEHHMDLVMTVCDELVVLDFGQVIAARHARPRSGTTPPSSTPTSATRSSVPGGLTCSRSSELRAGYGPVRALDDVTFAPSGSSHRGARRQRGRQDHPAAHDLRAAPRRAAAGRRSTAASVTRTRAGAMPGARDGARARGPRRDRRADRRGEPAARRAVAAADGRAAEPRADLRAVPAPRASGAAAGRSTLSGGERQMLAIGRALMAGRRLLLLDEPSLGLAPRIVAQIIAAAARPARPNGAHRAARRAERAQRAVGGRPRRRAQPRPGRRRRPRRRLPADDQLRHAYLGF